MSEDNIVDLGLKLVDIDSAHQGESAESVKTLLENCEGEFAHMVVMGWDNDQAFKIGHSNLTQVELVYMKELFNAWVADVVRFQMFTPQDPE